jgi:transcriptional regulatory protein GAL4
LPRYVDLAGCGIAVDKRTYLFDSGGSTTFGRANLLPGREMMDVSYVFNIGNEVVRPRQYMNNSNTQQWLTLKTTVLPTESLRPTIYSGMKAQTDFHLDSTHTSNRLLAST